MGAYHQMGHDSWNLVGEKLLNGFAGLVLSPVNDGPDTVKAKLTEARKRQGSLDAILDPQFYEPRSERGCLTEWPHFSSEIDTTDLSDIAWWDQRNAQLVSVAKEIGANAVCSPAQLPRQYNNAYYGQCVEVASRLFERAEPMGLRTLLTAIVRVSELAPSGRSEEIAGILTRTRVQEIYLVLSDDIGPRTQRTDIEGLTGAVRLIHMLESAGSKVLVAFSGLDLLLWKAAGAAHAATGKFFNLRRFVPGRFEGESAEGGRVVPYWTSSELITWLREDDVRLIDREGKLDRAAACSNPFSMEILSILDKGAGEAWVALAWRQYLYWFQQTEKLLTTDPSNVRMWLRNADAQWGAIEEDEVILFDRQNDGSWIRPWRNVVKAVR